MKKLLLILTVILAQSSFAQTAFDPITEVKGDTTFKEGDNKPYTGKYVEYYPGKEKVNGRYENGLKEGEFTYYSNLDYNKYRQCLKDSVLNFKAGKKEGVQRTFHNCPQESSRKSYKNGLLEGPSYYWDEAGQLLRIEHYEGNNLIDTKKYKINENMTAMSIRIKGFDGDSLPGSQLNNAESLELEVYGEIYGDRGYKETVLKNYKVKSFQFTAYWPGTDMRIKVTGNSMTEKILHVIKSRVSKGKNLVFWIGKLIIEDPHGVEYRLRDFKFVTK